MVIRALGAISRDLLKHLKTLGLDKISPSQLQKAVLLGTAHIMQNTYEIPRSSERTQTAEAQKHTGPKHLVDMRIRRKNNNNNNSNSNNNSNINNYNNNSNGNVSDNGNNNANDDNNNSKMIIIVIIKITIIIIIIITITIII